MIMIQSRVDIDLKNTVIVESEAVYYEMRDSPLKTGL